jgi:hypothetical protein
MPAAFYYRTSQAPAFPTFWVCGRKPHRLGNAGRASALFRSTVGYSADGPFIEGFTRKNRIGFDGSRSGLELPYLFEADDVVRRG